MKPLNLALVGSIGVGAIACGALAAALMIRYGTQPLLVTPGISVLFLIVGVWLLVGGRGVRRLKAREETWVTPIGAARVAALARASSYVMAGCAGFLGGAAAVAFTRMWAPATAYAAWSAMAGAATALFACVCAVVVERWCIDRDGQDRDDDRGLSGRDPSAPEPQAN